MCIFHLILVGIQSIMILSIKNKGVVFFLLNWPNLLRVMKVICRQSLTDFVCLSKTPRPPPPPFQFLMGNSKMDRIPAKIRQKIDALLHSNFEGILLIKSCNTQLLDLLFLIFISFYISRFYFTETVRPSLMKISTEV